MTGDNSKNLDEATVAGFGKEWQLYDQRGVDADEMSVLFERYFSIFPWAALPDGAVGVDVGCGSGRWAKLVAPRVGHLHCIDASQEALEVASRTMQSQVNCTFHCASVDDMPLKESSMDFGYSLGVLDHIPNTQAGIRSCARHLKPGAPLLLYLYYAFDNRPVWFRALWRVTNVARLVISRLPFTLKKWITVLVAVTVYWPIARTAKLLERFGVNVDSLPLSAYRDTSLYVMRNDAMDRFATRLERRFTRADIETMMKNAGLRDIRFSPDIPFWTVIGYRA